MIEQANFIYSAVVKAFKKQAKHLKMKEKQIHAIMNQKERQLDLNNNEQYITKKNKKLKIKEKQIYAIMNQKERQLDLNNNEQYITINKNQLLSRLKETLDRNMEERSKNIKIKRQNLFWWVNLLLYYKEGLMILIMQYFFSKYKDGTIAPEQRTKNENKLKLDLNEIKRGRHKSDEKKSA